MERYTERITATDTDKVLMYRMKRRHCRCLDDDNGALIKMGRWEDAEEEGRLLVLPCKPGDIVYKVVDACNFPDDCHTKRMCAGCEYREIYVDEQEAISISNIVSMMGEFGKTIFLDEKEANACKERMEKERNLHSSQVSK